ncbi:MAG: ABC transporter permease [Kofleriaceae bacterium]
MSVLGTKLRRDLWRLKGQVATIALVLACGIMAMIMLRSSYQSLVAARDRYYADYRFADVFARVERAPAAVADRLEQIEGVAVAYARIVREVMIPMPTEPDPVNGRIVSLPDDGEPPLCAVHLRSGRMPAVGTEDEAVLLEQFALAHELGIGARLPVIINGRQREVHVVGIALSPEYVLAMSGREMMADNRRFGVLWMRESAVAPAFDMDGAFDDIVFRLEPGASLPSVLAAIDTELAPYGGFHAIPRAKQLSNWSLTSELDILRTLALVIPAIFLGVAAFLVNVVVSRLVFLERTQIAVLEALGFTSRRIAFHYLALVSLIVVIAAAGGIFWGARSARWMTNLYADFYRFPTRLLQISPSLVALTIAIAIASAIGGAIGAVRRIAKIPPAQAMRPPAPIVYRRSLLDRLRLRRVFGAPAKMIIREIERKPLRFAMSTLGIAMGIGIFIMGRFSWDSFDRLMTDRYLRMNRQDLSVTFLRSAPATALHSLEAIPGVRLAEGLRVVPVRIRVGPRWRDTAITGVDQPMALRTILVNGRPAEVPRDGLLVTDKLAELLGARVGDVVDIDILEGDWSSRSVPIAGLVDEPFGLQIYADAAWLRELLHEDPRITMALLAVEKDAMDDVRARLKEMPSVIGVSSSEHVMRAYREQTGESMSTMTLVLTISAAAIAIGVVYNNARIALSMRSRDLASMRVLGFTRREISTILLGELGVQVVLGIPLGLVVGTWWARLLAASMDPEAIRFPLYIAPSTYAAAAVIALVSGLASALLVRRQLDRLDLIAVLKSSE